VTSGGNNFNDLPENQRTKSCTVYSVKANRGTKFCRYSSTPDSSIHVEWRWSQKDELNWRLFTATRSPIKPKSGCVTFHACLHCRFTICNYEILAKNSLPYQSVSNVLFFQL